MTERVSVLLSTRNRAQLLERARVSLHVQTYPAVEFLVLDDASSDETPTLLDQWSKREPRLRWFRRETSQGLAGR